ncbi:MAG: hypothetical protein H6710_12030 [Myxococcales bacterium]|nr:hypothetical protein [Myxococcales bacterium]
MKNTSLRTLACLLVSASLTACAGDDSGDSDTDATTTASTSTSSTSSTTANETTTDSTSSSSTDSTSSTTASTSSTTDSTSSTTDSTSSTTDSTSSTTDTTTDGTTTGGGLSFAGDVYFDVISPSCSCHVGGTPGTLGMPDSDTAYANLVGVASAQLPSMDRIDPGNTATSYLFHKINNTHAGVGGTGARMPPPPNMMLDGVAIATISNWISDGALP